MLVDSLVSNPWQVFSAFEKQYAQSDNAFFHTLSQLIYLAAKARITRGDDFRSFRGYTQNNERYTQTL